MKNLKPVAIFMVLIMSLSMALPAFAQDAEVTETPEEEIPVYIGTLEIVEDDDGDGDIVFTTLEGDVFIIAPAGSFNPSFLNNDPELDDNGEVIVILFQLEGNIVSEGDADNPPTLQVTVFVVYDLETDTDGDGIPDLEDLCPEVAPLEGDVHADTDGDGIGDACDDFNLENDLDNDGVADDVDICPTVANPTDENGFQMYLFDADPTDGIAVLDSCFETVIEDEDGADDETGEGGFYCRNRDVQHPNGGRIAEAYDVDYATLIADFCGDEGGRRGWGVIRNELRAEAGNTNGNNGNGNANGNNGNGNANGNNGNGNGNNGNNGNGNGNGNRGNRNG
ncbi:MAG: thrombospondin type 3 repeat-containing protein [Phototrophicaceae bacterium]